MSYLSAIAGVTVYIQGGEQGHELFLVTAPGGDRMH